VKLPLLLAQFLRERQHLRLPGIGVFRLSGQPSASEADAQIPLSNIQFEWKPVPEAEDALIDFIKEKTGKIKPLAIADLDSYIESGLQMLNIGKPFYIEGIGTIHKTQEGQYGFTARELTVVRQEEARTTKKEQADKRTSVFDDEKYTPSVNPWQKIVVAALILGGLAIVVFGGYYLYNQNNGESNLMLDNPLPTTADTTQLRKDTLNIIPTDSSQLTATYASNVSTTAGAYKFILETTNNKKRALRRYNQLRSYMLDVKMDTQDSVAYKLYFVIPASASDTARIKDSLSRYYVSKVRIEM
jgi:hypothetical protein